MEKELTRETVDPRYTWDLTRIYASDEAWEEAFADVKAQAEAFGKRAGTLSHGREAVLDALTAMMRMDETFFALHAYAMMKNNEDSTNAKYQAMSDRAGTLAGVVAAACSFMEPELLALEEGEIEKMIADPAFAEYDRYLSGVLRMKAHTLTASEEKLMAMASDACNAALRKNGYPTHTRDEVRTFGPLPRGKGAADGRAPALPAFQQGSRRAQGGLYQHYERLQQVRQHDCRNLRRSGQGRYLQQPRASL